MAPGIAVAQSAAKPTEPQKAALAWLRLIDTGKYAESYDGTAQSFRKQVTKEEWTASGSTLAGKLGTRSARALLKGQRLTKLPNMPDGNYAILQYKSAYANLPNAIETVVLEQESDGKWRVDGYFVKPAP